MKDRIRVNGTLYEAVDLRTKSPKFRTIPNGEDILFEDDQVGIIYTDRNQITSDDLVIKVIFAAGRRYRLRPFAQIILQVSEEDHRGYDIDDYSLLVYAGKRNIRNYLGGYKAAFDNEDDLKDTFDDVLKDIYRGMELSDEDSFVDTVIKSARKAIRKYGLSKMTV